MKTVQMACPPKSWFPSVEADEMRQRHRRHIAWEQFRTPSRPLLSPRDSLSVGFNHTSHL